jgi:hypothetical protein
MPGQGLGLALIYLVVAAILGLLLTPPLYETGGLERMAWLGSSLLAAGFIAIARWRFGLAWLSPPIIYGWIFWLFHFGLVFPAAVASGVLDIYPDWAVDWLYYPESGKAAVLAAQFLGAFFAGWMMVWRRTGGQPSGAMRSIPNAPDLIVLGWWVIVAGGFWVVRGIMRHGAVFTRGYDDFFPVHYDFSWALFVIAFGLALHLAGGRSVRSTLGTMLWAYLPLALLNFLAGARTAPLATGTVLVVILGYRGYRLSRVRLIASVLIALAGIAVVQQTRGHGIEGAGYWPAVREAANPLSGMMELGGSLRPVSATVNYVDVDQRPLLLGASYGYPAVRVAEQLLGSDDADPREEPRLVASHFAGLYRSAMGFSVVAEAYVNGDTFGVFAFALLWGALLGVAMSLLRGPYGLAILAAILMPMIVNIRNSFIFVPGWLAWGIAALLVGRLVIRPALLKRGDRSSGWSRPALLKRGDRSSGWSPVG